MATATEIKIHPFEKSGLGEAPFACIGMDEKVYQAHPGAPSQPGGTCDHCGTAIRYQFHIRSRCGKVSKVGCDCIAKLNRDDNRLMDEVERLMKIVRSAAAKKRSMAKKDRENDRIKAAFAQLNDPLVAERFAAMPHPRRFKDRLTGYPLSLANYVEWMRLHAFHAGRLEVAKMIEKTLA